MKRLLVLAALSTVGTGCVVHDTCDARTVSIGWPSFKLASGDTVTTCGDAGVNLVDVFMDGAQVGGQGYHFPCSDRGVNVTGVLNDGNHVFDVEALDGGNIALRDSFTVGNSNCNDQVVDTQPSESTFTLNYSFSPDNICVSGTDSFIWFRIRDEIANQTIAVDSANDPRRYTCGNGTGGTTPVPISFPLAWGLYTLLGTEEVVYPVPTPAAAGNCNATPFTIQGGKPGVQVNVGLTDGVSCF